MPIGAPALNWGETEDDGTPQTLVFAQESPTAPDADAVRSCDVRVLPMPDQTRSGKHDVR